MINDANIPIYFNVIEYKKFINIISDSILWITTKKGPFVEFGYSVKEITTIIWKGYWNASPPLFQLHIHVRLDFFFTYLNQNDTTQATMQK